MPKLCLRLLWDAFFESHCINVLLQLLLIGLILQRRMNIFDNSMSLSVIISDIRATRLLSMGERCANSEPLLHSQLQR